MYVLLVANVIFYLAAGFDQFLVLLLATAVSYVVACKMGKLHEKLEKQKQEEPDRLRVLPVEIRGYLFGRITSKEIHGQF